MTQGITFLCIYPRENVYAPKPYIRMFIAAVFIKSQTGNNPNVHQQEDR